MEISEPTEEETLGSNKNMKQGNTVRLDRICSEMMKMEKNTWINIASLENGRSTVDCRIVLMISICIKGNTVVNRDNRGIDIITLRKTEIYTAIIIGGYVYGYY